MKKFIYICNAANDSVTYPVEAFKGIEVDNAGKVNLYFSPLVDAAQDATADEHDKIILSVGADEKAAIKVIVKEIADAYGEIFSGYDSDSELSVQFSEDSETVVAKNIQFYSMCEHHMLPFYGTIQIAYVPNGRVFGISKLVRVVEKFSKRLQIQERIRR